MQPPPPSEVHGGGPPRRSNLTWLWIVAAVVIICGCGGFGVLGSIVAPVILRAKAVATMRGNCIGNVKRLVLAQTQYANDFDDVLPQESRWADATSKYVNSESSFTCPALLKSGQSFGYAANVKLSGKKLAGDPSTFATVLIYETASLKKNATGDPLAEGPPSRHGHGRVEGYLDGHLKWNRMRAPSEPR